MQDDRCKKKLLIKMSLTFNRLKGVALELNTNDSTK